MRETLQFIVGELRGMWRYRWIAMVTAWIVCLVGWFVVYAVPDTYESRATIYVDTTSTLKPLLESLTVETDVMSRVELVTKAMLGKAQLEEVATETNMHLRASDDEDFDDIVSAMGKRITLGNPDAREPNLFEIKYRDRVPVMAQTVVSTLLNNFVEDSLGANREDTIVAQEFLREQLDTLEEELVLAEQQLAAFKRENVGRMPGEGGDYFARLQTGLDNLVQLRAEIRLAERKRDTLEQQLRGNSPVTETQSTATAEIDLRILQTQNRLEELKLRFTDQHPDVISTMETLSQLQAQRQDILSQLSQSSVGNIVSANPVFQKIQMELATANVELAALQEREQATSQRVRELQGLVDVLPQVEAELARLNRDYDVKQSQYQSLLQRLEVAELSESAERSQNSKFRVIEQPLIPEDPAAPNRPLLLGAVFVIALGIGGAVAFFGNQLRPVFSDRRSLGRITGFPVLGSVVSVRTPQRRREHVTQLSTFVVSVLALAVLFVAAVLLQPIGSAAVQNIVIGAL